MPKIFDGNVSRWRPRFVTRSWMHVPLRSPSSHPSSVRRPGVRHRNQWSYDSPTSAVSHSSLLRSHFRGINTEHENTIDSPDDNFVKKKKKENNNHLANLDEKKRRIVRSNLFLSWEFSCNWERKNESFLSNPRAFIRDRTNIWFSTRISLSLSPLAPSTRCCEFRIDPTQNWEIVTFLGRRI